MRVGSGIGPRTCAPVRFAVLTISRVDASRIRWSNALRRMRIFWPFIAVSFFVVGSARRVGEWCYPFAITLCLFDDACDDAGTNRAAAFTDGEAQLLFHRDRHDQ